jgi:hypothetical protein
MALNLGFNYSHLQNEDKESSADVKVWEVKRTYLALCNWGKTMGAASRLAHRRGLADPYKTAQIWYKNMEHICTVTRGGPIKKYAQTTPSADVVSSFLSDWFQVRYAFLPSKSTIYTKFLYLYNPKVTLYTTAQINK